MSCVLLQVYDTNPRVRVFDEISLSYGGTGELMTQRMAKEIKYRYPNATKYVVYPDPAGQQRRTSARFTDHDILRKEGFLVKVKRQAPRVIDRLNAVNNIFKSTIVDPKCKGLIRDFEQVCVKEGTRDIDKSNKKLTHLSDAFGYYIDFEHPITKPQTKTYMR